MITLNETVPLILVHHFPGEVFNAESVADCGARPIPGKMPQPAALAICPVCEATAEHLS